MDLVELVYELSAKYPSHEQYVLTAHTRKTVISIPSNIAEGKGRRSRIDYKRFLIIAYGSLSELRTQIEIAVRLRYIHEEDTKRCEELADTIGRMLYGLIRSLS